MICFEIDIFGVWKCTHIIKWWLWPGGVYLISHHHQCHFMKYFDQCKVVYNIIYQSFMSTERSVSQCETFNCSTWSARSLDLNLVFWLIFFLVIGGPNYIDTRSKCTTSAFEEGIKRNDPLNEMKCLTRCYPSLNSNRFSKSLAEEKCSKYVYNLFRTF